MASAIASLKAMLPPELVQLGLNALNVAMFLGGLLVKLPQIIGIVKTWTVKGMSEASLVMEFLACCSLCSYNLLMGHPFKTWGEMALITVQCGIQIALFWKLTADPIAALPRVAGVVLTISGLAFLYLGLLPDVLLPVLGMTPTVLGAVARVPQIVMNFRQRHTGNQSVITWTLSSGGNVVRIITTLATIDDWIALAGHVIAGVLNITLVLQILFFWQRTMEVIHSKDKDKKK